MSCLSSASSSNAVVQQYYTLMNGVHECRFTWTIDDFNSHSFPFRQKLKSEEFPDCRDVDTKWQLLLYPRGRKNNGWLEISVKNVLQKRKPLSCNINLSILNLPGSMEKSYAFGDKNTKCRFLNIAKRHRVKESKKDAYLCDGRLTINCTIRMHKTNNVNARFEDHSGPEPMFQLDMASLLIEGDHADVILKAQDKEFLVHRAILSCRSPVLSSMINTKDVEKYEGKVILACDEESAVMEEMLKYIYSGKCSSSVSYEKTVKLYEVAIKYHLPELRDHCSDILAFNLSIENVASILDLAHRSGDDNLKEVVKDFVRNHSVPETETNGCEVLQQNHPETSYDAPIAAASELFFDAPMAAVSELFYDAMNADPELFFDAMNAAIPELFFDAMNAAVPDLIDDDDDGEL